MRGGDDLLFAQKWGFQIGVSFNNNITYQGKGRGGTLAQRGGRSSWRPEEK